MAVTWRFGETVIEFTGEGIFFAKGRNAYPINIVEAITEVSLATGLIVRNEIPEGDINGQNVHFQSLHPFVPESVEVFLNGNKMSLADDYLTEGNNKVSLFDAPEEGEILMINYSRI